MKIYEKPNAEKILLTALEEVTGSGSTDLEGSDKVNSGKRPGL